MCAYVCVCVCVCVCVVEIVVDVPLLKLSPLANKTKAGLYTLSPFLLGRPRYLATVQMLSDEMSFLKKQERNKKSLFPSFFVLLKCQEVDEYRVREERVN